MDSAWAKATCCSYTKIIYNTLAYKIKLCTGTAVQCTGQGMHVMCTQFHADSISRRTCIYLEDRSHCEILVVMEEGPGIDAFSAPY